MRSSLILRVLRQQGAVTPVLQVWRRPNGRVLVEIANHRLGKPVPAHDWGFLLADLVRDHLPNAAGLESDERARTVAFVSEAMRALLRFPPTPTWAEADAPDLRALLAAGQASNGHYLCAVDPSTLPPFSTWPGLLVLIAIACEAHATQAEVLVPPPKGALEGTLPFVGGWCIAELNKPTDSVVMLHAPGRRKA